MAKNWFTGLHIERKLGMYGTCHRINAYADGKLFALAVFDAPSRIWGVDVINRDGSVSDYSVHYTNDSESAMQQVEAILRLAYRQNFARAA